MGQISSAELSEWMAAERLGLLPDPWLQTGVQCAAVANSARGSKGKPARPADFMPRLPRPRPEPTPAAAAEQVAAVRSLLSRALDPRTGPRPGPRPRPRTAR